MPKFHWKVMVHEEGQKLLFFIKEKTQSSESMRALKRVIEMGCCLVNGKIERFASTLLHHNDEVALRENWSSLISKKKKEERSIEVLYEDEDFLIVNKPVDWLCEDEVFQKAFSREIFLIHRLDKSTSGVLLLAKNLAIKEEMKKLFLQKEVKKSYLAIVDKPIQEKKGKIVSYLEKKHFFQGQTIWGSNLEKKGTLAITEWNLLYRGKDFSTLLCHPITGRTHQIRVHLLEMGHPILGDYQYSRKFSYPDFVNRIFLHSWKIGFMHPKKKEKIFVTAPIPEAFLAFLPKDFV